MPTLRNIMLFVLLLSATSILPVKAQTKANDLFRASAVKIDVTPDIPKQLLGYGARVSTGVHDRIYHRIVVMDDGEKKFVLVSSDFCVMSPSEYDHVAAMLKKRLGIDPVNFWWSLTHTHSAPEVGVPGLPEVFMGDRYKHPVDTAYTRQVEEALLSGVEQAIAKLQPAKLGIGWGYSQANINRRAVDLDGKATLGLNPEGPVDRKIGLLRIDAPDGSPIALIPNYAIHGTVLGPQNLEISGDVTGVVCNYLEEKTGATVLFINGAAGNIAPIYSVYPNPKAGHLSQFRPLLGDKILAANSRLTATTDSVKLRTGAIIIESPRKKDLNWPADMANYTRKAADGSNLVRLPIRFLKINEDIAIWSAPVELFCEISNEVRDRSPFAFTFYYGYTNGWLGYLPSEAEWKYGGYEVNVVSPFTQAIQGHITEGVVSYLESELSSTSATQKTTIKKSKK